MPVIFKRNVSQVIPISPKIISDILKGNYYQYLETIDFEEFLSKFLDLKSKKFFSEIGSLDDLVKEDKLKHVYNFFKDYIVSQNYLISDSIVKKFLKCQNEILQFYIGKCINYGDTPYNFAQTDSDITQTDSDIISSYYLFTSECLKIKDFIDKESGQITGKRIFDLSKSLLMFIVDMRPNITQDSVTTNQTLRYPFEIIDPLTRFVNGSSHLVLQLKNGKKSYHFVENSISELLGETAIPKIQPAQLSNLRHLFLSQYHHGYDDLEKACLGFFNITTGCYHHDVAVVEQFQDISQGLFPTNFTNAPKLLKELLLGSETTLLRRFKDFSETQKINDKKNNKLSNFLNYFKRSIAEANEKQEVLSADFVKDLSTLFIKLSDIFKENIPRPKILNTSLSLFLTLLKNPSIDNHASHLWPVLRECADQVNTLLKNYANYYATHNADINTSLRIFSDILHQTNNINAVINDHSQEINAIVGKFSLACLNSTHCDSLATLNQFYRNLGTMAKRLFKNSKFSDAQFTIENAQALIKNATNKVSEGELKGIAWSFLSRYHYNDVSQIAVDCEKIFNLTNCQEWPPTHVTLLNISTTGTAMPNTTGTTTTPISFLPNASFVEEITSTTPVAIVDHNVTTKASDFNITLFNQTSSLETTSIAYPVSFSRLPTTTEIGASAAHGFVSALINTSIQAGSTYLGSTKEGHKSIIVVPLSVLVGISQAFYLASFPFGLQKLYESMTEIHEEEALAQQETMQTITYIILFSAPVLSIGLQLLNYYRPNYLAKHKQSRGSQFFKACVQSIPTISTVCNIVKSPILTGINIGTAYTASTLGLFGLNWYLGRKNRQNADLEAANENKSFEMEPLNDKKDVKLTASDTTNSGTTEEKHQYITEEKFNEVKQQSEELLNQLKALTQSLSDTIQENQNESKKDLPHLISKKYEEIIADQNHVFKIIENQTSIMLTHVKNLKDNIHDDADKHLEKNHYHAAMEKLGNVFKLMSRALSEMRIELNKAEEFVKAKSQSFDKIINIVNTLNEIIESIQFPLSTVTIYLNKYSLSGPIEVAEKNGAKKALANKKTFDDLVSVPVTIRKNSNDAIHPSIARSCSLYSMKTRSSGSSSDTSDTSGKSQFGSSSQLEKQNLIHHKK